MIYKCKRCGRILSKPTTSLTPAGLYPPVVWLYCADCVDKEIVQDAAHWIDERYEEFLKKGI